MTKFLKNNDKTVMEDSSNPAGQPRARCVHWLGLRSSIMKSSINQFRNTRNDTKPLSDGSSPKRG